MSHHEVMSSKSYELKSILKKSSAAKIDWESDSAMAVNVNDWVKENRNQSHLDVNNPQT